MSQIFPRKEHENLVKLDHLNAFFATKIVTFQFLEISQAQLILQSGTPKIQNQTATNTTALVTFQIAPCDRC